MLVTPAAHDVAPFETLVKRLAQKLACAVVRCAKPKLAAVTALQGLYRLVIVRADDARLLVCRAALWVAAHSLQVRI